MGVYNTMQNDVVLPKSYFKKYGLKNPKIVLYLDGNNIFIREFATHYNTLQNSDSKDIGTIVRVISYIQDVILRYEKEFGKDRVYYNLFFERGRSSQHKNIYNDYKQNRNNKFLGLDFDENDKDMMDKRETFRYNMEQVQEILKTAQKKINFVNVYYTEGDFQIRYFIEKYNKYFIDNKEEVIHVIFSTDSDFRQLLSDKSDLNIVIYDIIKKRLQTKYNYHNVYIKDEKTFHQDYFLFEKVISGDKSDNIKGIKGIGQKKQLQFYNQYKQLFNPTHSQKQFIESLNLYFEQNKDTLSNIDKLVLQNINTMQINYKMTNLINFENVVEMINMNQIADMNSLFSTYIEYKRKYSFRTEFFSNLLKDFQKNKLFSKYKIIDEIDILKFLRQVC